ncbi:MAG TPA: HIT domain-containing protein [Thermoguttaceae bacterium]|nr:HIT domain-containing protein [Thermoguttaceae bacterium]
MVDDPLWAPWRLDYIVGDKLRPGDVALNLLDGADPGCFLCQAAVDEASTGRYVIQRGEHTVTILNRFPYNNGHLLVAPKAHVGRLDQLDPATELELTRTIARMVKAVECVLRPDGFNIGLNLGTAAGAGVPDHLHWHIVPRWNADTNFMPVLGRTNVIPQSLEAFWELLTAELRRQS